MSWLSLTQRLSLCLEVCEIVVLQVQQSMHEQGQALNSPLQQPLHWHRQSVSSSPKQSPLQAEQHSFGVDDADQAEQSSFAVLAKEAANAMHQVRFRVLVLTALLAVARYAQECSNRVLFEASCIA